MKRTRWTNKLPDAINRCSEKRNFTQVSNTFIRDPNISGMAKAILTILLSNKEGWTTHLHTLRLMMKEGRDAIVEGIKELIRHGYFSYVRYRDKDTKTWKGSFWAYTDVAFNFTFHKQQIMLEKMGYEIVRKSPSNVRNTENPEHGKPVTNNTKYKKEKKEEFAPSGSLSKKRPTTVQPKRIRNGFPSAVTFPPFIIDDGRKYYLCNDFEYRNKAGDVYIP